MAQDVPLMRQVRVAEIGKGVFGTLSLGVYGSDRAGRICCCSSRVCALWVPQFPKNPFLSRIDLRLKAIRG